MALRCPVVVSNRASLPEIGGDAALFASPRGSEAGLEAFLRLRNDARLRAQLVARGQQRIERPAGIGPPQSTWRRWRVWTGCQLACRPLRLARGRTPAEGLIPGSSCRPGAGRRDQADRELGSHNTRGAPSRAQEAGMAGMDVGASCAAS